MIEFEKEGKSVLSSGSYNVGVVVRGWVGSESVAWRQCISSRVLGVVIAESVVEGAVKDGLAWILGSRNSRKCRCQLLLQSSSLTCRYVCCRQLRPLHLLFDVHAFAARRRGVKLCLCRAAGEGEGGATHMTCGSNIVADVMDQSPPFFCATSEMRRDVAEDYVETEIGFRPKHKFEQYIHCWRQGVQEVVPRLSRVHWRWMRWAFRNSVAQLNKDLSQISSLTVDVLHALLASWCPLFTNPFSCMRFPTCSSIPWT